MATINQRVSKKTGKLVGWQVIVRRKGYPSLTKTFKRKGDADAWARTQEHDIDKGTWQDRSEAERTTVADLLDRYAREVLPTLKGGSREHSRVDVLKNGLGRHSLAGLSSMAVAEYRDKRMSTISRLGNPVSNQTVKHELGLLQRALKKAVQEWGVVLPLGLPTAMVKMPKVDNGRTRRLEAKNDEEKRLLVECDKAYNIWLSPVVIFAIESAMRAGEILETKGKKDPVTGIRPIITPGLFWEQVDMEKHTAFLPKTKNGDARTVPLSSKAMEVLRGLPRLENEKVFDTTYEAIHLAFDRACKRAGIKDFRFHDLRHEATSRLFDEKGLNPMQAKAITGHKTLQMLVKYTHLRAEDLVKLLG